MPKKSSTASQKARAAARKGAKYTTALRRQLTSGRVPPVSPWDGLETEIRALSKMTSQVLAMKVIDPEVFMPKVIDPELFMPKVIDPELFMPKVIDPELFMPKVGLGIFSRLR